MTHVSQLMFFFFFNDTATTEIYTLSLHDALPISEVQLARDRQRLLDQQAVDRKAVRPGLGGHEGLPQELLGRLPDVDDARARSEEHTSELQSRLHLVCRLLLEKKNKNTLPHTSVD